MKKERVLFICTHNSARSQMAEALMNHDFGARFEARSAGYDPGTPNPLVAQVLSEIGIDIAAAQTKKIFDLYRNGELFRHVISLCDGEHGEHSPVYPGVSQILYWSFPDPALFQGPWQDQLQQARQMRDAMRERIGDWCCGLYASP